jgi:hypothetical protein
MLATNPRIANASKESFRSWGSAWSVENLGLCVFRILPVFFHAVALTPKAFHIIAQGKRMRVLRGFVATLGYRHGETTAEVKRDHSTAATPRQNRFAVCFGLAQPPLEFRRSPRPISLNDRTPG